jgi:hypothetical protein
MTDVALERPAYKDHHLWIEAIALAHQVYAVADALADRDPEEAHRLRRLAVSVPALLAGALEAEENAPERAADVSEARAALRDLASSAERWSGLPAASAELPRRVQALDGSVALELGLAEDGLLC